MATHKQDSAWPADIRANAQTWSLEGDAKLLDFMKHLSKKIEKRGNGTTHNLHKMQLDLDRAQVALGNTTNRLMSLQHSQFVENRVYDDDETLPNLTNILDISQSSVEKPSLIDALQYALNSGVKMMDKYYEKVTFELSDDSEDDEVDETGQSSKSVIFRPKNPYQNRPLPHLIGSKDWQEKWHIGLTDSDADDGSDNDPIDEMSASTSSLSPSMASLHSHVPASMSESENSNWGIDATNVVTATGLPKNVERDIFKESSEDDEGNNNSKTSMPISNSTNIDRHSGLRDELLDRVQKTNNSTANTIFRQQSQTTARVVAANLFDSEPPELDESLNISSAQCVDRKPVNLFLDDDDDGFDIFVAKYAESKHVIGKAPSATVESKAIKSINLFKDDEIDYALFGSSAIVDNKPIVNSVMKSSILSSMPLQKAIFHNLFDDKPPEDDFDFLTNSSTAAIGRPEEVVAPTHTNDKSNETEKLAESVKTDAINTEPSSKSVTEMTPAKEILSKINLFDDDADEDDSFEKLVGPKVETVNRMEVESKSSVDVQLKVNEDDDDIFEQLIGSKEDVGKKSIPALDNEQLFVEPKTVDMVEKQSAFARNIFDDESDLDDPFIEPPVSNAPEAYVSDRNEPIASSVKKEENLTFTYASSHLFNDLPPDDDEDFTATAAPIETKQSGLGEFYNDFSGTVTVSSAEATKSQYSYLFNDEPPPDDDLFQSVKPKKSIVSDPEFSRKLNVFANPEQLVDELRKAAVVTKKPKKLNLGNFDINVAALLPGAKRLVSDIKSDAVSSSDAVENEIENVTSATSAKSVDDAGRLKNLTRDRAKTQMRRPSTRRGRQQQYQKTLEVTDDTEANVSKALVFKIAPATNANSQNTANEAASKAKLSALYIEIEERDRPDAVIVESSIEPISIEVDGEALPKIKTALGPVSNEKLKVILEGEQEPPEVKNTYLSFLDNSDGETPDDDDWLSNVIRSTTKVATESRAEQDVVSKMRIESFEAGLFGEDDDKTKWNTDSPVAESKISANTNNSLAFAGDRTPPLLQSNSLFEDLKEPKDEDDIFAPVPVSVQHSVEKSALASQQPKTQTSLFDDEDGNESDLFGNPPPLSAKRTVVAPVAVHPSKSLFGDEISDDDDLFIASKNARKGTESVAVTSGKATVLNSKKVPSGKLFSDSDSDDDDDLFGSKAKPSSNVATKSAAPNVIQNRITKAKASAVADQDPLADLLK